MSIPFRDRKDTISHATAYISIEKLIMVKRLNSLPDVLVNSVFQDWLNLVDLSKIDTASCNHTIREWYLLVFDSVRVPSVPWYSVPTGFYDWVSLRKIKLKSLKVTLDTLSRLVGPSPVCTDYVESIVFRHGDKARERHPLTYFEMASRQLALLVNSCLNLTCLNIATPRPTVLTGFSRKILGQVTSLALSSDLTFYNTVKR